MQFRNTQQVENKLLQALNITCLWQERTQLIYQASEQGSQTEKLEEGTKEADGQIAQQRFCVYISYQTDSLGCLSPHLQFVLYWPKQSNRCHCDTDFWATCHWLRVPPGGSCCAQGGYRAHRDKAEMSQHLCESGPTTPNVFWMDLLQALTSKAGT